MQPVATQSLYLSQMFFIIMFVSSVIKNSEHQGNMIHAGTIDHSSGDSLPSWGVGGVEEDLAYTLGHWC